MRRPFVHAAVWLAALLVPACARTTPKTTPPLETAKTSAHIEVQHILIGFSGSVPGKSITRTKDEARQLAYDLLDRARKGEDFSALVSQYTDDKPPGIYKMSDSGVPPGPDEFSRDNMVPGFGSVSFGTPPGEIAVADYDPQGSPYGWHVIKRLR